MSIRNLDSLLDPASLAVIGASERPGSMGATVWHNMHSGGFSGAIHAVNPKYRSLSGRPCHADVSRLPNAPELAIICTPARTVVPLVRQLARCGIRAVVILSSGLDNRDKQAVLDAARPTLMRLLGPNCIGLLAPHRGINASLAPRGARAGKLAVVSQSGAVATAMLDWAEARQIGFSQFVSLGEQLDVDFGDMLDYLASDAHTRAILLYLESVTHPRKFMSAARAAARNKPVIVVQAGRSDAGRRAVAAHSSALGSTPGVLDAAIARAGMLRVDTLEQLFAAAEILTRFQAPIGAQMTILTNGGGLGIMAADAAAAHGVPLAELPAELMHELDSVLPAGWPRANPMDIGGDARTQRHVDTVRALARHRDAVGTLLLIHAPTARAPAAEIANALLPEFRPAGRSPLPVVSAWVGGPTVAEASARFTEAGLACYALPEQAVAAIGMLQAYARNQEELTQAPSTGFPDAPHAPDIHAAREIINGALADQRQWLTGPEAQRIGAAYGIAIAATDTVAADPEQAVRKAERIGYPVALELLSPDIHPAWDAGHVARNLDNAADVRSAAQALLARVVGDTPRARIGGLAVRAADHQPPAQALRVGARIDPLFGPVILLGPDGAAADDHPGSAVALPPLNEPLARALVARIRPAHGNMPAADLDAVITTLQTVSSLLADIPEIAELQITPLLAGPTGVIAPSARIRISADRPAGASHFAIAPYPAHLTETRPWQDGQLTLRPIRPEDEQRHLAFLQSLDADDIRMRVFYSRRHLPRSELARMVQIDYTREMAFVATTPDADGQENTLGVVRTSADPDNIEAEFSIILKPGLKGEGLGRILMEKIIAYQRSAGTHRLIAFALSENMRMRGLARSLGFTDKALPDDPGVHHLELVLN